jgi:hypothetical protein
LGINFIGFKVRLVGGSRDEWAMNSSARPGSESRA